MATPDMDCKFTSKAIIVVCSLTVICFEGVTFVRNHSRCFKLVSTDDIIEGSSWKIQAMGKTKFSSSKTKTKYKYNHKEPSLAALPSKAKRLMSVKKVLALEVKLADIESLDFDSCPVQECQVTTVRFSNIQKRDALNATDFDAVVIPIARLTEDVDAERLVRSLQPFRTSQQRWILRHRESPKEKRYDYSRINKKYLSKNVFNWTWTYRPDSDIYGWNQRIYIRKENHHKLLSPFWQPESFIHAVPTQDMHEKTKLVFWAVSHCKTMSKREDYVMELKKYLSIDILGECGNTDGEVCPKYSRNECTRNFGEPYKFYLSFENSICEEYVTEKIGRTIRMPVVPIVMGGGPYERYYPRSSYIDVFDFESPKDLANYLLYLDNNNKEYLKYFEWKKDYIGLKRRNRGVCELCAKLHDPTEPEKTYADVYSWWYRHNDGTNICKHVDSALTFYSSNKQNI